MVCKAQNSAEQRRYRNKNKIDNIDGLTLLIDQLLLIKRARSDNQIQIQRNLYKLFKIIVNLFREIGDKWDICAISNFIKFCKKINNIFYEIAEPCFDDIYCHKYNQMIKQEYRNVDRQMWMTMCRICARLTWSQNDKMNKMVSVCCMYLSVYSFHLCVFLCLCHIVILS